MSENTKSDDRLVKSLDPESRQNRENADVALSLIHI